MFFLEFVLRLGCGRPGGHTGKFRGRLWMIIVFPGTALFEKPPFSKHEALWAHGNMLHGYPVSIPFRAF